VPSSMTITDAAYHVVHDYPGGAPSLAPRVGIASPKVLDNKVAPGSYHHKLTLNEAVKITDLSGDLRILNAWNAHCGCFTVPMFDGLASDMALLDAFTSAIKEMGDVSAEMQRTLEDGRVTQAEVDTVEREAMEACEAVLTLVHRLRCMAVDDD